MRKILPVLSVLALSACAPDVPDSAAGVGFDDYSGYQQQREIDLSGETTVLPPERDGAETAAAETPDTAEPGTAGEEVAAAAPYVVTGNNPGISDEQDFEAVTERESIESDRARIEAQRAQYKFIEPEPVPARGGVGPNIVEYAINTSNQPGQALYRRIGLGGESAFLRKCGRYSSSDLAQEAFLKSGGPERDPKGLDPDGDGFACFWDPTPFRAAVGR